MKYILSTNALKIIAVAAMVCDHIPYLSGTALEDYYTFPVVSMHIVGRLTAPIFFYLAAVGYSRTGNVGKYLLRLFIFAMISYIPFVWYFAGAPPWEGNYWRLNIIFTMLVGLALLWSVREVKNIALKILCIAVCVLLGTFCDYGLFGIACIFLFGMTEPIRAGLVSNAAPADAGIAENAPYAETTGAPVFPGNTETGAYGIPAAMAPVKSAKLRFAGAYCALVLVYSAYRVIELFTSASPGGAIIFLDEGVIMYMVVLLAKLLPLPLMLGHCLWQGAREPRPAFLGKWFFYIFYPAHICILLFIRETILQ